MTIGVITPGEPAGLITTGGGWQQQQQDLKKKVRILKWYNIENKILLNIKITSLGDFRTQKAQTRKQITQQTATPTNLKYR